MVATSKAELLAVTTEEFDKLTALLLTVDPDVAVAKDDDGISIKDVIGQRAHWLGLFFGWYEAGQAGRDLVYIAPGYKGNESARYNADLREAQGDLGWESARSMLTDAHQNLMELLSSLSDEELYGRPMVAPHKWTTGRWAEANGASHYRSAARYVRSRLRNR